LPILQDKDGKTPLYVAVDNENVKMIDLLYSLGKDGPDSMLVNSVGWTVLHAAAQKNNLKVLETLMRHFTSARKKIVINTKDKTGRTPLHIASFRGEEEVIGFLIQHGARNDVKDVSSLCPSQLANRQGRRDSKELIEEKTGYNPDLIAEMEKEMAMGGGARRGSMRRGSTSNRASKETVGPPEAATGA
jgi:ankyrin repeat protein